ncbi:proline-rich domain-containing protein [Streptomyces sp. NPDC088147]|uniref:proline-rich domain-containing protein n=1 Tax=unclassified Streptomyces TaxID=2593676 RepID=UPI0033A9B017
MSFGDPNNPYGQQPQPGSGQPQGQPGYGYPQGQPQQPGYGYPQAPPVQPYGGGFPGGPGGPQEMPGGVKAARVMLWVISGLCLIGTFIFFGSAASLNAAKDSTTLQNDSQFQDLVDGSSGFLYGLGALALVWLVLSAFLAIKVKTGGSGFRTALIVYGVVTALIAIYPFTVFGIVHLVLAILIAVFAGKSDGAAWFNRPRY